MLHRLPPGGRHSLSAGRSQHVVRCGAVNSSSVRRLRLPSSRGVINWDRWELVLFQTEERRGAAGGAEDELEDDAGLSAPGAVDAASARAALDAAYFTRMDDPSLHEQYLRDAALMGAFREALLGAGPPAGAAHPRLEGAVVLDVGCGPGAPLAIQCARAGAKRVVAVDASAGAVAAAQRCVEAAGLSGRVEVVCADAAALTLKEKVDVIVSNWMGPALLAGGMLRPLMEARRRLLKPGGVVLPGHAELLCCGVDDKDHLLATKQRWERPVPASAAKLDLSAAMPQVVRHPRITPLERSELQVTSTARVATLDLNADTCTTAAAAAASPSSSGTAAAAAPASSSARAAARAGIRSAPFELTAQRDDRVSALALWFDVAFPTPGGGGASTSGGEEGAVRLSTGPRAPPTHFQQVLFNFPKAIRMQKGEVLAGSLSLRPDAADRRRVDVDIAIDFKGVQASASYALFEPEVYGGAAAVAEMAAGLARGTL